MPWYCNIEKDTQERSLERRNLAHYKMQCNIIERAVCQGAHPEVLRRVSHTGQSPSPWPSTISCAQAMPATRGVCKAALVRALRKEALLAALRSGGSVCQTSAQNTWLHFVTTASSAVFASAAQHLLHRRGHAPPAPAPSAPSSCAIPPAARSCGSPLSQATFQTAVKVEVLNCIFHLPDAVLPSCHD